MKQMRQKHQIPPPFAPAGSKGRGLPVCEFCEEISEEEAPPTGRKPCLASIPCRLGFEYVNSFIYFLLFKLTSFAKSVIHKCLSLTLPAAILCCKR